MNHTSIVALWCFLFISAFPAPLVGQQSLNSRIQEGSLLHVEATPQWCGAKALWHILTAYGKEGLTVDRVLAAARATDRQKNTGALSLQQLVEAANVFGFQARGYQCLKVSDFEIPAITVHHIPSPDGTETLHARVMVRVDGNTVYFIDPLYPGRLFSSSLSDYQSNWTSHCLVVLPEGQEFPANPDQRALSALLVGLSFVLGLLCVPAQWWRSVISIFSALLFLNCGCQRAVKDEHLDRGAIAFVSTRIKVDDCIVTGEVAAATFAFRNSGNKPIRIADVVPSCSCTVGDHTTSPLAPGEGSDVTLRIDGRARIGEFTTSAQVYFEMRSDATEDSWKPVGTIQLIAVVNFVPRVTVKPKSISFREVLTGETATENVEVINQKSIQPGHGLRLQCDNECFSARLLGSDFDTNKSPLRGSYNFEITFAPRVPGLPESGVVTVYDESSRETLSIPVYGRGGHPMFRVEPESIALVGPEFVTTVKLATRTARGFAGFSFSVDSPDVICSSIPVTDGQYNLKFTFETHSNARTPTIEKTFLRVEESESSTGEILVPLVLIRRSSNDPDQSIAAGLHSQ